MLATSYYHQEWYEIAFIFVIVFLPLCTILYREWRNDAVVQQRRRMYIQQRRYEKALRKINR